MESRDVIDLGRSLMNQHDLDNWIFALDRSKVRFGVCKYKLQVISVSKTLSNLNTYAEVRNTILHEIAHVYAGAKAGHGYIWQHIARGIGCDAKRCYNTNDIRTPEKKVTFECPECNMTWKRHRLTSRRFFCVPCYRTLGNRVVMICYRNFSDREVLLNEKEIQSVG